MEKNKGGRPPIPPEQRRQWLSVRLSPEAAAALEKQAEAAGLSEGRYLDGLILAAKD